VQYVLTPYSTGQEPYAWWENAFSNDELNWLQKEAKDADQRAKTGMIPGRPIESDLRRSNVKWLTNTQETKWVFERLAHVVSSLNSQFFRFDLTGFGEALQLTNYDSSEHGTYGWHVDFGSNTSSASRKLSVVLQLSDPSEYEGGNLELMPAGQEIVRMKKQRGLVVAFPSWTLHQVTPVTQGTRQSLVIWTTGPAFK
jgi:PKHD-type hydroxylase